jgi:hypothetical protein
MIDALTNFTDFVIKPSAPFAAGVVLFGAVWGFFKGVESVLTDDTKLEIAVWLLGVKVGQNVEPWPETFARVFDRVFGAKHLSWRCFLRSGLASYTCFLLSLIIMDVTGREIFAFQLFNIRSRFLVFLAPLFVTVVPDYLSLLETRFLLRLMQRYRTFGFWGGILALDLVLTGLTGVIGLDLGPEFRH